MSYIVAYVQFPGATTDYPVECFRTDIRASDHVVVRLGDGRVKTGVVTRTLYLHWDCKSKILCRVSEAEPDTNGNLAPVKGVSQVVGLASADAAVKALEVRGWVPLKASHLHHSGVTYSNDTETANILFRKNGVDLQILSCRESIPQPYQQSIRGLTNGRVVRHFLSQTTFNLYEGVVRFADKFFSNENEYSRFFKSVGSRNRATNELRARVSNSQGDEPEMSLREALEGCEDGAGQIYLSDGMYI